MGKFEKFIPKSNKGKAAVAGLAALLAGGLWHRQHERPQPSPTEQSPNDTELDTAKQPERRPAQDGAIHTEIEQPEDTGEAEKLDPLAEIDFNARYIYDFPDKDLVIYNERPTLQFPVKQMDSIDKRIYDQMQEDGEFALAYQKIADSLEWTYDGEYAYVTSTNTDITFDLSFNIGAVEPYTDQRLVVSHDGINDRNEPVKDDVEAQVYKLLKYYVESAAYQQTRGE